MCTYIVNILHTDEDLKKTSLSNNAAFKPHQNVDQRSCRDLQLSGRS
jgi:hypothetical protein